MNESSIVQLTVTKYLTFLFYRYFLWTIKINCRRFICRLSTNVMTLLLTQIHSETNIFSVNQSDLRERKERIHNLFIWAWGSGRRVCLKIPPSRKNEIYLCTRRLTKALPWPVGKDRKILTGSRTNQIAGGLRISGNLRKRHSKNETQRVWLMNWFISLTEVKGVLATQIIL